MEFGLGHDFSRVRIHSGQRSAASAHDVGAQAYTVGSDIVLGVDAPTQGRDGRHLLAHELTHVVQQSNVQGALRPTGSIPIGAPDDDYEREAHSVASASDRWAADAGGGDVQSAADQHPVAGLRMQRLVRAGSVACPPAAAGIANPHTGSADRQASALLDTAITRITNAQANQVASPADPDVVAVGGALNTVFHLDPAAPDTWTDAPPAARLPLILRRLQAAKSYIDSVVFTVTCIPNGGAGHAIPGCAVTQCVAGTEAFSCHTNPVELVLCPSFWALNVNQRGRVWMHEVMHITFASVDDWANPNITNAHCYAQFVALLNGFNSPPLFRCP